MLLSVPEADRSGFLFNPKPYRILKGRKRATDDNAGRVLAKIGKAASVVVDKKEDKTTYASAHDLRSSFGFRWSRRVMPPVLQELMRHESIQTTLKYYVGQDAQATAAELLKAVEQGLKNADSGNYSGNPATK